MEVYFHNTSLKQFYGIVFSKCFLWGNSAELYSQNIFFRATLQSCIPTLPFEAILQNYILKTFHLRQLSRIVFPHSLFRQLCGVVFSKISFEEILWNYILKIFHLRQFCGIVFSKYSLWGNFTKSYSKNISFEVTLQSCILKTLPLRQFY